MPLLEEGLYHGKLVAIGTDQVDNKAKTPFVFVQWEVTHRAQDDQWVALDNPETRESRWWVTDKAEPYTMDRLMKLGFNGEFHNPVFSASPHPANEGVELVCSHDIRDDQAYENWDIAGAARRHERAPWNSDTQALFKARYRTRMSASAQPQGAPPAAPGRAQPDRSPIRDEEVPGEDPGRDVPDDEIPF